MSRKDVIKLLSKNNIECRPIVTGNFTRNEVMKYFEYEIHNKLSNADYLHYDGFFVGNHQEEIKDKILALNNVFK